MKVEFFLPQPEVNAPRKIMKKKRHTVILTHTYGPLSREDEPKIESKNKSRRALKGNEKTGEDRYKHNGGGNERPDLFNRGRLGEVLREERGG